MSAEEDDVALAWGSDFSEFEVYFAIVAIHETAPPNLWVYRRFERGIFASATVVDERTYNLAVNGSG